jgi:hypothetical protein
VTIVGAMRPVTGSGEMHPDLIVAPRLVTGGFPATLAGHRDLLGWLAGFGPVARVGRKEPAPMARA